uniref:Uncharacterized protein n=1 Tax=Oryza barthii TaxID=65489 RepID=A0A679BDP2_9ORYZ|nr:hypothetical protein [Oryza barthii]
MEPLLERREDGRPQKTMTTQWREAILGITMDEAGDEASEDPYAYYQEGDEDDGAQ